MLCSQNSPLKSALAALSCGPASTQQDTFAHALHRWKVLKTCRLPIYLVHTTCSVNEGTFYGFLEESKSLEKMHLKTLSGRDFRKHTTLLDHKNCRLNLNEHFANRCSDISADYHVERNRNGVGLAHFIFPSATKKEAGQSTSMPTQTLAGEEFSWLPWQCI